jgi:hypothetical protein
VDAILGAVSSSEWQHNLLVRRLRHEYRVGALHPEDGDYTVTFGKCTATTTSDQRKRV